MVQQSGNYCRCILGQKIQIGNWNSERVSPYTPYLQVDKYDILQDGLKCCDVLGVEFDEVYKRGLNIMDMTAFTLSQENNLPIIVFDMNTRGNLLKVVSGEKIGTKVNN